MNSPLKSGDTANYQSSADQEGDEYIYEEDWLFSERTKRMLIAGGVLASVFFVYLFCVILPNMFIPELRSLEGIPVVQDLRVVLRPVDLATVEAWNLGEWAIRESDEDDDQEETQEAESVESNKKEKHGRVYKERMILVGDIHGELKNLKRLLRKLNFDSKRDHLVILGDFISKGPDSIGVVELLDKYNAECVLGNHEYYVLNNYAQFHGLSSPFFVAENSTVPFRDLQLSTSGFNFDPEYLLAKKLEPEHVAFINKCLLIKRLGSVPLHSSKTTGGKKHAEGLAVHAGLQLNPLTNLNEQDPISCLEMRSYLGPHFNETTDDPHEKNAVSWSKIWNAKQKEGSLEEQYVVYYGHDARRGLNLKRWAKGLDTGCSRGDDLSAMVVWQEKTKRGKIIYKEQPVSVLC